LLSAFSRHFHFRFWGYLQHSPAFRFLHWCDSKLLLRGARVLFQRDWTNCVAIGFVCLFSNSVLLSLAITERAYGTAALNRNYAIVALHAPYCYMMIVRAAIPAALFGLGGVLYRYRPEGRFTIYTNDLRYLFNPSSDNYIWPGVGTHAGPRFFPVRSGYSDDGTWHQHILIRDYVRFSPPGCRLVSPAWNLLSIGTIWLWIFEMP